MVSLSHYAIVCLQPGRTPLYVAAINGRSETVAELIKAGGDINIKTIVRIALVKHVHALSGYLSAYICMCVGRRDPVVCRCFWGP